MADSLALQLEGQGQGLSANCATILSPTKTNEGTIATNSTTASPRSGSSPSLNSSVCSSTDSEAKFNPLAIPFMPTSSPLSRTPATRLTIIEQRPSKNAGIGLFAKCTIPRGSLVLSETPLLSIHANEPHLVWGPYCRLSNGDKTFYDSLHSHQPEGMNLEAIARTQLIDYSDKNLDAEDIDELVAEQARVMGVFAVNNFQKSDRPGLHIFKLVSRINHSCVPNVFHSYNPTLGRMQVHALKDIDEGDEIATNYLGFDNAIMVRSQRIERLRATYGFTCQCSACIDMTRQSDIRREFIHHRRTAVQYFVDGVAPSTEDVPIPDPGTAMREIHRVAEALIREGLEGMELAAARRLMSAVALMSQNFEGAMQYANWEAVIERNCMGVYMDDLITSGRAAILWIEHVQRVAATHVIPGAPYRRSEHCVNPAFAYCGKDKKKTVQKASKRRRDMAKKMRKAQEEHAVVAKAAERAARNKEDQEGEADVESA